MIYYCTYINYILAVFEMSFKFIEVDRLQLSQSQHRSNRIVLSAPTPIFVVSHTMINLRTYKVLQKLPQFNHNFNIVY